MEERVKFILETAKGRILDIGFNVGPLHSAIIQKFGQTNVYGIDITVPKNTAYYKHASCEKMPFKGKSFDTAVAGELIEHLENPNKFLREAYRVLKPSGILLLTTPNVKSLVNRLTKSYHAPAHLHLYSKEELLKLLKKHGFQVEKLNMFPFTEESSSGSRHKWSFVLRKILHWFLPESLQEDIAILARKV